jgi:DNA invertase Pin-like site-specific DNA recombinase
MSLIATWFSEGRRAQHPPVPRYRCAYADGGFSGGNMERPALQGLLADSRPDRYPRHLQGRPADTVARQFCAAGRDLRRTGCHVRAAAQQLNTTSEMWGTSRSICRTTLISFKLFSTHEVQEAHCVSRRQLGGMSKGGIWQ